MVVVYAPFMQVAFGTVPLNAAQWGVILGIAGSLFVIEEMRKVIAPKLFSRGKWTPARYGWWPFRAGGAAQT
jgi:hypothetical protein